MSERLCDCPKCGKPSSTYGDRFCGKCETEYAQDQEQARSLELAEVEKILADHHKINPECDGCHVCIPAISKKYRLTPGMEYLADSFLNR
jgi:hypothetical protein